MLADAIVTVGEHLWSALAAGTVGDRAGAEWSAFAKRALEAPSLEAIAAGTAAVPKDPELIYFLGASCLARLGADAREEGDLAAKAVAALGAASKEVAVWIVDAALATKRRTGALQAFDEQIRTRRAGPGRRGRPAAAREALSGDGPLAAIAAAPGKPAASGPLAPPADQQRFAEIGAPIRRPHADPGAAGAVDDDAAARACGCQGEALRRLARALVVEASSLRLAPGHRGRPAAREPNDRA
jgi:hypothetical protein